MRLKQRRNVLLPQPDGPISAVTWFSGITRLMSFSAWFAPYQKLSLSADAFAGLARVGRRSSSAIESDGLPDFRELVSPCIGAACVLEWAARTVSIVAMSLTS